VSIAAFLGALAALAVLFVAGLRLPVPPAGPRRIALRALLIALALGATLAANVALFKRDLHLDLTRERAFTPAAETRRVIESLREDVRLVYFYQKQNPGGLAAKTMVEILGKMSPRLHVETVDPDRNPGMASRHGVRLYNVALLMAAGEQVEVQTTDDREIALGILRLLRRDRRAVCFGSGQGEYDADNFEFHTHFEGQHAHSHDTQGMAIVQMEQHGLGRLRRALEKLGYAVRKTSLALERAVPEACAALVEANPRTAFGPPGVAALEEYLARGGNVLLLLEPDYQLEPQLAALLERAGVRVGEGVIADPASHYYTDEQMVAVSTYARHPATLGLALSFFPGARPLERMEAPGVRSMVLFSSSDSSVLLARSRQGTRGAGAARAVAIAAEGALGPKPGAKPFRLAVVGDADFASNSFFPYLSNADLLLGLVAWLRGEERGPAMRPPVEVLPTVALTNTQMQGIFVVSVFALPGLFVLLGAWVWWRRRY
jgi:hypothetical protein